MMMLKKKEELLPEKKRPRGEGREPSAHVELLESMLTTASMKDCYAMFAKLSERMSVLQCE